MKNTLGLLLDRIVLFLVVGSIKIAGCEARVEGSVQLGDSVDVVIAKNGLAFLN